MLYSLSLSYLENSFVVFYLSFYFIRAPGASARFGIQGCQSKEIGAVHYFAHPCTPKALQLFKRQFHPCNLSDDDLLDRVKEVADSCVVCAQSKARWGPHLNSCQPFPVPSYLFASVAMDFVSLPEVKNPGTGVKVDYAIVVVCCSTGYILAIPCRQERLTSQ